VSPVEACRSCGGLFPFLPRGVCAECIDLRERRYREVREWLLDNRGASILQACEATGVEESLILSFIREGRLEFVPTEAAVSAEEEEIKARIRRDMAARGGDAAADHARAGDSALDTADARLGMRTRTS
jgi:hypothetical protein